MGQCGWELLGQKSKLLVYYDSFASKVLRIQVADRHNFHDSKSEFMGVFNQKHEKIDFKPKITHRLVYKIIIILYIFTSLKTNKNRTFQMFLEKFIADYLKASLSATTFPARRGGISNRRVLSLSTACVHANNLVRGASIKELVALW